TELGFGTYARIDGFFAEDGQIFLNDPNTTSGMLPSSFFFHQAAEIGLNPSQFLTYILRQSVFERQKEGNEFAHQLMEQLDEKIMALKTGQRQRKTIAVLLGGSSFERHISVESGRNVYEKLASSDKYRPVPVFLTSANQGNQKYALYQLPINLLLKDNADDIRDKVLHHHDHPVLADIRATCQEITDKYADTSVVFAPRETNWDRLTKQVDGVFIALHGRPGEDGQVQMQLEARGLPYNGSGVASSSLTINKYRTLQTLKGAGMSVADQYLAQKTDFLTNEAAFYATIEERFGYPLIAKPVDDGCSSAVKVIKGREELRAYVRLIYKVADLEEQQARKELKLKAKEEFPCKEEILFEELITAKGAEKFLEITGGMITHAVPNQHCYFEVFEPSEALAGGEILSLEEKFLAGEGQNLTPARLYTEQFDYEHVATQVKADLLKAAKILGVRGYCRIDAFVRIFADGKAETLVIEVNSLPGMTPATAIFHQAALANFQPYQFIDQLLEFGFSRNAYGDLPLLEERPSPLPASVAQNSTYVAPAVPLSTDSPIDAMLPEQEESTVSLPEEQPEVMPAAEPQWKRWLAATWAFIRHPFFWRNVGVLFAGLLLAFLLLRGCLSTYTHHGEGIELPNFEDMMIVEAERIAQEKGLQIKVIEGQFDPNR
ncbi:MAG: hypothetical protein AAF840_13410, partial [Bacteroidota bacterium]